MALTTILILGGYGVFGQRIARALIADGDKHIIVAGRDAKAARAFASQIDAEPLCLDIHIGLEAVLAARQIDLVINCAGPFQGRNYTVPRLCIRRGVSYIDLADARAYVAGFNSLRAEAEAHNVFAATGMSTVPAVSGAVVREYLKRDFSVVTAIDIGVTPGNRTPRGVATAAAILSYVGQEFMRLQKRKWLKAHGWQDLHRQTYPGIGRRWLSACDVPDLDLIPCSIDTIETVRFSAGLELPLLHLGLWGLSWLARLRVIRRLERHAALLRTISLWFYRFGSDRGAMHVHLAGIGKMGQPMRRRWYLLATHGDGPQIPCIPAIVMARKMLGSRPPPPGVSRGGDALTLDEIREGFKGFAIREYLA